MLHVYFLQLSNADIYVGSTDVPQELAKHGVACDVDTVRKWLKEASQLLPRE
jgi:hypothetical protein